MRTEFRTGFAALALLALAACATEPGRHELTRPPTTAETSAIHQKLRALPAPSRPIVVAVYNYPDETGQYKPSETIQSYSRAVTQGGASILIKALQDAGEGSWFTVVERAGLQDLLTERRIIADMRAQFLGNDGQKLPPPDPLIYAAILLEGGIIGFDSNTRTGGAGARYLGIGADIDYREDTVTVYLRATHVLSGRVLKSVQAQKSIISYGIAANVFRFVAFKELLEIDAGLTANEPGMIALKQAIEQAVYSMVVEGAEAGIWKFADRQQGAALIEEYRKAQADILPLEPGCEGAECFPGPALGVQAGGGPDRPADYVFAEGS